MKLYGMMIFMAVFLVFSPLVAEDFVGEVIAVRGNAWIVPDNGVREKLERRRQVAVGDKILTAENSYVKIFLIDDSVLTVGANSRFVISKFIVNERSRISIFNLIEGKVKAVISKFLRKGAENRVLINTPTAVAGVRGTEFVVETNGQMTEVGVLDGEVEVRDRNGMGSVILKPGYQTMVRMGGAPMPPRPLNFRQIRKLKREFFTGKSDKREEAEKAARQSFKVSHGELLKITKGMTVEKPKVISGEKLEKPPVDIPLSLGNNALVHIRVIIPR